LLTLTETGEQHNLPAGELECVVMHVRLLLLDLPEPSHFLSEPFPGHPVLDETKSMLALDLVFERDLRAGKKAHGHVWFADRGIELLNFVDTSLSPTFAGRDATYCRL
jgi:hypothetical protein